jgi:RNA polymerase sigma-70 factor (ECF subfamily)
MDRLETRVLLEQARAGSPEALNDLYARVASRLLAIIRLRLGSSLRERLESRDILHSVLLRSFQRIGQFQGQDGATLMGWLARMAENEIRDQADFHRRQRRDHRADVALGEEGSPPVPAHARSIVTQLIADERAARLERAIAALSPEHQEVILLRKLEELSWNEVAARMGRTEDACRMLLARAMVALTLKMREQPV